MSSSRLIAMLRLGGVGAEILALVERLGKRKVSSVRGWIYALRCAVEKDHCESLGHYPGINPLEAFGICPLDLVAERKRYR